MTHTPETIVETLAALQDVGALKDGEIARTLHAHGCGYRAGGCTCPGGPELVFADWDEAEPKRGLWVTPERFYAQH